MALLISIELILFSVYLQLQNFRSMTSTQILNVEKIVDLFIEAGIHVDAVNIDGLTATQICVARKLFRC